MGGIKHYSVNGTVYDIPEEKKQSFLDYHKKQGIPVSETALFSADGTDYDIPFEKVSSFITKFPDAKLKDDSPYVVEMIGKAAKTLPINYLITVS